MYALRKESRKTPSNERNIADTNGLERQKVLAEAVQPGSPTSGKNQYCCLMNGSVRLNSRTSGRSAPKVRRREICLCLGVNAYEMMATKSKPKVSIAGSRRLSRLGADVWRRIDNIIDRGFAVLVGDANGVDKAVQQYLVNRRYANVMVFCMEGGCRNNVGDWETRIVASPDPRAAISRTTPLKTARWYAKPITD